MRKIRILLVDDSVVIRRLLTLALSQHPCLEIAGVAANGRIALQKLPQISPDIVILDVEMPEMNGLEMLAVLRKSYRALPVIIFSQHTIRGAAITLDALALGANDYVTKRSDANGVDCAVDKLRAELIPRIISLCSRAADTETYPALAHWRRTSPHARRIDIVAIASSTGGPNALAELIPELPSNFPVPIIIVQHMPPLFTSLLAQRLAAKSHIPVAEAIPGCMLEPGKVWLAPGDFHMVLHRQGHAVEIQTHQGPPENSCRPAADVLFRSVAETYGARTLAIVMTGIGQDGLRGCERIRQAGGQILVQDRATSVVWGMPGAVAQAGFADKVLPLNQMAGEILLRTQVARVVSAAQAEYSARPREV